MRECLSIRGGVPLHGEVSVSGAKNSALPLLMATLLTPDECRIQNVPNLEDISVTIRLLEALGAEVDCADHVVTVRAGNLLTSESPHALTKMMRASFWVLGPLLARTGEARVPLPGGDAIGARPVDLHVDGLVQLGADVRMQNGSVIATAPGGLQPARISLRYPSVGATHHLLMTAALIDGVTIIEGAAREPEIVDLAHLLSQMGASIEGAGSATIAIRGKKLLHGASCNVLGDRIEAATYLTAGALTRGSVCVRGINSALLPSVLDVLESAGAKVERGEDYVRVSATDRLRAVSFETAPFPGVATDVQPLLLAAMTSADGECAVTETVFEHRFGHVHEYRRFGSEIHVNGRVANVIGKEKLKGCMCEGGDIRAAAGLILMALSAEGTSEVYEIHHLDRGYENMVNKLRSLGADIVRSPAYGAKELVMGC